MQFGVVTMTVLKINIPSKIYWSFALIGALVFVELIQSARPKVVAK